MSEADAVLPASNDAQQLKEQQNGLDKLNPKEADDSVGNAMDVDTEEDDSQITSSTENGRVASAAELGDDATSDQLSTAENTKDSDEPDSSSAVENNKSKIAVDDDEEEDALSNTDENEDSHLSESKSTKINNDEGESVASADDASQTTNGGGEEEIKEKAPDSNSQEAMDEDDDADPLAAATSEGAGDSLPKSENGNASNAEKSANETVNLDDSDDEQKPALDSSKPKAPTAAAAVNDKRKHSSEAAESEEDDDDAVVIGSDSENDDSSNAAPPSIQKTSNSNKTPPKTADAETIEEDDDDDCVVIEDEDDDDVAAATPSANDLSKRKSLAVDAAGGNSDSQPPSKKQRSEAEAPSGLGQLTIKDARSLMPQEAAVVGVKTTSSIFPVNITPAPAVTPQELPKLVPVSLTAANTLSGLTSNANLLPGLTDDMFVLEAPSFIVPYIYEKPPADNLQSVVKEIATKCDLTKEDLAQVDKVDEFDMMTEQNKDEKPVSSKTKKKKRRNDGDDDDDSWSEDSDNDDDDEDSDGGVKTKVLIKEANDDVSMIKSALKPDAAAAASSNVTKNFTGGQEDYFENPLGKFFMDIGVGLVQEFVQSDLIRLQKRRMRKSGMPNNPNFERAIVALTANLEASKKKNAAFKFTMKRCEFCNFKSESALSMANHYETPHMNGVMYKCNFCVFEIRNATEIVYHMEAVHNIKARLVKPLPYHQCPNCGFEDNGKAKLARHQPVCARKFRPEINLAPPNDWEAPAKIPRIKPRHGLVGTATAYQAMAAQAAAQKAALASIQQQQQQVAQARSLQAAALAAQAAANKMRGRGIQTNSGKQVASVVPTNLIRGGAVINQVRSNAMASHSHGLPHQNSSYQLSTSGQMLQQTANALAKKTLSGQPSISITPLPRQTPGASGSPSTSKGIPAGMKPGQSPSGSNKAQFVICEICDGYIKDLEQLRNHMQWMHKVKIHPKMIYNRPPLNCQKCQFRFFTDQGLERHLLGSHGLVTSSMQEAANKGKDAGRCPVCGRMYQWKLLNHVSRDHHMTLKPAHLSYKCTVCTATFGMYKQFETHVYTAHSTVAKKAMDGKKGATPASGASGSNQRSSLSAANDSLLKPLKINDEITIIPQPASKPRITNMESHVID